MANGDDNSIDVFLPSTAEVQRAQLPTDLPWGERQALVAEHGYAALIRVHTADRSATLLFDAGISTHGLIHNMDVLDIKPHDLQSIVLSHGHADHTQGLVGMLKRVGQRHMPLLLHPDAFYTTSSSFPMGMRSIRLPQIDIYLSRKVSNVSKPVARPILSKAWC